MQHRMISIRNLSKSYGTQRIFFDLSLDVVEGEVIAVIGPSGTGKSTLLRCCNLLEKPDSGHIFIGDEDILAPGADVCRLRRKMGMVFQSFNLFSHLMVMENIMLAPTLVLGLSRQEAWDVGIGLLHMVGLGEKACVYPGELYGRKLVVAGSG